MKTIRLLTCDNLVEAHLIQGRLANEGIDCFLTNQNFTNLVPMCNMMGAGIQVIIDEKNYQKAVEILKDKIDPENTILICPNCNSKNIGFGFGKSVGFKIFNIIIALLALFPFGNLKPMYYCKDCKTEIK